MIGVLDIVQIAILYLAIYALLKRARGSRFGQALMGAGVLAAAAVVFTFVLHLDVLAEIMRLALLYLALSSVVIFQPEIRRFLAAVGALGSLERRPNPLGGSVSPEAVVDAVFALSREKTGALVAFERGISLRGYEDSGVMLKAVFSPELVKVVFTPPLPLHDGGMTIRGGRISAAHCVFPVSNNPELASSGMRHRAAVGLSEETDAIVVVVSEETGGISVARDGRLFKCEGEGGANMLRRWVERAIRPRDNVAGAMQKAWKGLMKFLPGGVEGGSR